MTSTCKFVYISHHFFLLRLNPFGLRVDREVWQLEHSMSQLRGCLLAEGSKKVSRPSLFQLRGWGSLTMTSIGKFQYSAHHFILLRLDPFGLSVNSEGWWFQHSTSQFRVFLSAEGAKNVSLFWLYPPGGWGSLTMTSTGISLCMAHHFILLWLNPFGVRD